MLATADEVIEWAQAQTKKRGTKVSRLSQLPPFLSRALAAAVWRSRASVNRFLSFACSSAVIAGFSRFAGRSSTGKYSFAGAGASARASIKDELELAQPPSQTLSNNVAVAMANVICFGYAKLMLLIP